MYSQRVLFFFFANRTEAPHVEVLGLINPLSNSSCNWTLSSCNSTSAILRGVIEMGEVLGCNTMGEYSLTTRQPVEYSWMSGNPTPLTKIGQSLLCMGNFTQNTTCPNILQRPHRVHMRVKWSLGPMHQYSQNIYQLYYMVQELINHS